VVPPEDSRSFGMEFVLRECYVSSTCVVARDLRIHIDVIHSRNESNLFDLTNEECVVCEKFKAKFESMDGLDHDIVCEKQ